MCNRLFIALQNRAAKAVRDRGVLAAFTAAASIINPLSSRRRAARERQQRLREAQLRADAEGCVVRRVHGSLMRLDVQNVVTRSLEADLAAWGSREPSSTAYYLSVLHELKQHWAGERPLVLDVGANVGYYALMAANVFQDAARIVAIEPDEENAARLRHNIALNAYKAIEVKQAAAGATSGVGQLVRQSAANWHKMIEVSETSGDVHLVPTITLDDVVDAAGCAADSPLIVRMDIEGYEGHAFKGMKKLLASNRQMFIFVEVHREASDSFPDMVKALRREGFYMERLEAHSGVIERGVDLERLKPSGFIAHAFLSKGFGGRPLGHAIIV